MKEITLFYLYGLVLTIIRLNCVLLVEIPHQIIIHVE